MLDFTIKQKGVSVAYGILEDKEDVRAIGTIDDQAAEEMVLTDRIANSIVTQDNIYLDGRTGAYAQTIKQGKPGDKECLVKVDYLGFNYSDLNKNQRLEFRVEALKRNCPTNGYRRFSVNEDYVYMLERSILEKWSKKDLKENFYFIKNFDKVYNEAKATVTQRKISEARQLLRENKTLSIDQAAKMVGLDSTDGIIVQDGKFRDKTINELRDKQSAIKKACNSTSLYYSHNLRDLRAGRMSGLTANRWADWMYKQLKRLEKVNEDGRSRLLKEVAAVIPKFHTK